MKEGWQTKKLGEIATVIAGQSPSGDSYNTDHIGTPFYQGKKDYGKRFLQPPTVWTTKETKIAEAGDLLMSVRAPVGALNFTTQRVCIGRGLAAIRTSKSCPDFLYYALSFLANSVTGKDGAVFASISKTEIEDIFIPLPPLEDQKRIVGILDAAFEKIDAIKRNAEQNLANAKELFQRVLDEEMTPKEGWKKIKMNDLCKIDSVLVDPREKRYCNLLHIGGGNIISESGKLTYLLTAKEEKLTSGKFTFTKNDILPNSVKESD